MRVLEQGGLVAVRHQLLARQLQKTHREPGLILLDRMAVVAVVPVLLLVVMADQEVAAVILEAQAVVEILLLQHQAKAIMVVQALHQEVKVVVVVVVLALQVVPLLEA